MFPFQVSEHADPAGLAQQQDQPLSQLSRRRQQWLQPFRQLTSPAVKPEELFSPFFWLLNNYLIFHVISLQQFMSSNIKLNYISLYCI